MGLGEGEWWLLARASIHRKERERGGIGKKG